MATGIIGAVRHLEGYLCRSFVQGSLASAFPHGGTAIGEYRDMRFIPGLRYSGLTSEAYGGSRVAAKYVGEQARIVAVLRDWDDDALSILFPNTTASTSGGGRRVDLIAGASGKNFGGYEQPVYSLCFSPKDLERDPMHIFFQARPLVDDAAELQMSLSQEAGLAVVFEAIPDSNKWYGQVGRRETLSASS